MINEFASRQFVAFLLTGGTAALINFISRIIYNQWLGFSSAVILAYLTGMVTGCTSNARPWRMPLCSPAATRYRARYSISH